jgi:uncharacterized protein
MIDVSEKAGACSFAVSVKTSSGRTRIAGEENGVLRVEVNAPPVEGKANAAVIKLIARALDVAPSRVSIVAGEKSKKKRISVSGTDRASVEGLVDR